MKRSPLFIVSAVLGVSAFWVLALFLCLRVGSPAQVSPPEQPERTLSVEEFRDRGNAYYAQGDYKNARKAYGEIIALRSDQAEGYRLRGLTEYKLDDFDSLVHDMTNAIRFENGFENGYEGRAGLFYMRALGYKGLYMADLQMLDTPVNRRLEEMRLGLVDLDSAIRYNPKILSAWLERGWFRMMRGDNTQAIADLNEYLSHNTDLGDSRIAYSQMLVRAGSQGHPTTEVPAADVLTLKKAAAHMYRGYAYWNRHQIPEALSDASLAASLDPANPEYNNMAGWYLYESGRTSDAIPFFRKAANLDRETPWPYFNIGLCYAVLGKADESANAYRQARITRTESEAYSAYDEARLALQKQPNSPALQQAVALLKRRAHVPDSPPPPVSLPENTASR